MDSNRLDYYALLGIDRSASGDEIGRAYRRAARATHPDTHPDEPSAGERFTAIAVAYETLSDPARRASYDQHRPPTTRAYRVEPVASREAQPSVVPIRPRPNPEPLRTPDAMRIEGPETIEELAASLSLLLHWTRRSF